VGGVVAIGVAVAVAVALAIDVAAPHIPIELEARLFSGWFDRGAEDDEADAPRERSLAQLLNRMAGNWPDNSYVFEIAIWDETEPNAVALPGGVIAVTNGLLESVESENELAFVLGHELGHFHNRDHLRGLGRGIAFSLLLVAVGVGGGGSAVQLASLAGQFAQRDFSRDQEIEADRFGLALLAAEYGHVSGAAAFFEHLPERDGTLEGGLASYFSTHPVNTERIQALHAAASEMGWELRGERQPLPSLPPTR
jgi:Zn-dependent protease with chaperone function